MHCNGLKLSGALEEFSITFQFWGSKCKNQIFEENKGFACIFFRIEVQVTSNPSRQLEKHQTSKFLLINIFYDFLKIAHFPHFPFFSEKNQLHILKSL